MDGPSQYNSLFIQLNMSGEMIHRLCVVQELFTIRRMMVMIQYNFEKPLNKFNKF